MCMHTYSLSSKMSINPNSTYETFDFLIDGELAWRIDGPLSGDLAAGLTIGLCLLLDFENGRNYDVALYDTTHHIIDDPDYHLLLSYYYEDGLKVLWETTFSEYTGYPDEAENIIQDPRWIFEREERFAWNITNLPYIYTQKYNLNRDDPETTYAPILFRSADFIQGFISIMNAFQVDFRDYVLGPPYKFNGDMMAPAYYSIQGYDIPLPQDDPRYIK